MICETLHEFDSLMANFVLRLLMQVLSASFKQAEKKVENDLVAMAQWLNKAQDHCNRQAR